MKLIRRVVNDPQSGQPTATLVRVPDNYIMQDGENEAPNQGLGRAMALSQLPSRVAAIGGALAGLGGATRSPAGIIGNLAATGGQGVAAAGNTAAAYLNRMRPDSKLAAVGAGAISSGANQFSQALTRNIARSGSTWKGVLSGLGAGLQGALAGGLGAMPGGETLSKGVAPLLGGLFSDNPVQGIGNAFGSMLQSNTLGNDLSSLFTSSKVGDYAGGQWGQDAGVADLTPDETAQQAQLQAAQAPAAPPPQPPGGGGGGDGGDGTPPPNAVITIARQLDAQNQLPQVQQPVPDAGAAPQPAPEDVAAAPDAGGVDAAAPAPIPAAPPPVPAPPPPPQPVQPQVQVQPQAQPQAAPQQPINPANAVDPNWNKKRFNAANQWRPASPNPVFPKTSAVPNNDTSGLNWNMTYQVPAVRPAPPPLPEYKVIQTPESIRKNVPRPIIPAAPPPPPAPAAPPPQPVRPEHTLPRIPQVNVPIRAADDTSVTPLRRPLKAAPREDTGQELPVRARQPVGGVPEGKNPSTREAFRAFGDRGINRNLPRQLHIDTINENQARDWYRSPEFRAKDSRGAEELMRRYGAQTGLIPRLLDYEEDKKNRIEDLGDENYTYAGKSVPNFHPRSGNEMPNIVPYSQMHKMTPDEIEQETNALNDWQQRQLDREIEEPEGSTEHYTANHERYEFGEGIPHLAEMASRIAPTSRFRIQGDNMYDSNPEDYQEHEITFPSNKIYTRTPLGMLQTGGIEQLTPEQRDVTKRIRTLLHAHSIQNEENKDSTLLDTAREFYNGLPPEAKGFRERMPEQNRKLAIRNAMTDLTKMTNPKELKAKWNSVFENAVDGGMSDKDLTELRDLYKLRKYELSRGTLEGYEMHRAGIRARSGVSHSGRDVSHTKRQKQEEARWAASRRGTYGELTSRFGTGQKLEFIKQRRLMDRAEKLEGAGRAADYLRVLTGKIQDYKADEAQYKERLDGARGDERADIIKELDSIRQNLRELELRHKYATSARD